MERINSLIQEGNFYEAHQVCISTSTRFAKQGKHENLQNLVFNAMEQLAKAKQYNSTVDILNHYLELLSKENNKPLDVIQKREILKIWKLIEGKSTAEFMQSLLKTKNDPVFNHYFGMFYLSGTLFLMEETESKDLSLAMKYLLSGTKESFETLANIQAEDEVKVSIILRLLLKKNIRYAIKVFGIIKANKLNNFEDASGTVISNYGDPLINFAQFMIIAIQRNSPALVQTISAHYDFVIRKNADIADLVGKIKKQMGLERNPLEGLMNMFTGAGGPSGSSSRKPIVEALD